MQGAASACSRKAETIILSNSAAGEKNRREASRALQGSAKSLASFCCLVDFALWFLILLLLLMMWFCLLTFCNLTIEVAHRKDDVIFQCAH